MFLFGCLCVNYPQLINHQPTESNLIFLSNNLIVIKFDFFKSLSFLNPSYKYGNTTHLNTCSRVIYIRCDSVSHLWASRASIISSASIQALSANSALSESFADRCSWRQLFHSSILRQYRAHTDCFGEMCEPILNSSSELEPLSPGKSKAY